MSAWEQKHFNYRYGSYCVPPYVRQRLDAFARYPESAVTDAGVRRDLETLCCILGDLWCRVPVTRPLSVHIGVDPADEPESSDLGE
jgi:hypothetical protein